MKETKRTFLNRAISLMLSIVLLAGLSIPAFAASTVSEQAGYKDVAEDKWYYDDVMEATERGLMEGVGNGLFEPEEAFSRAMFVTVLHRLAGEPEAAAVSGFSDVKPDMWYTDAIDWAKEQNVTQGVGNNKFGVDEDVTREQMMTFLYRYADTINAVDEEDFGDLSGFSDRNQISDYAQDAAKWCVGTGIIRGVSKTELEPKGVSTRAQASAVFVRFGDYLDEKQKTYAVTYHANGGTGGSVTDSGLAPNAAYTILDVDKAGFTRSGYQFTGWSADSEADKADSGFAPGTTVSISGDLELYAIWEESETGPKTYTVKQDGSGDFTTIQEAVDVAQPGDTVEVYGGIYREEVVLPQGGTDEENRITLKAAEEEEVIVTGADKVEGSLWTFDSDKGVYVLELKKDYFGENAEGEYFNPFAVQWMSKGGQYSDYFTCGCVYINDVVMAQKWAVEDVSATDYSWYAVVDEETGATTIYANFGDKDPANGANNVEINSRMQCVTAKWNQGYITVDGLTIMRGCGPKTIDFWMTTAEAMYGAIATNGGYHWIIENCDVTQNRGVAIDFGNGSGKQELKYGGEPELYGYHIIRYNNVSDNGTNGMMAYRGAYTEIHNNVLANNNALNTGLLSEGYIKDVSGGWGINIHDNYLYSDQSWSARPIWLDCESDGSIIANNVIYNANAGFTYVDLECNAGWILVENNVLVGVGWGFVLESHAYLVNNLLLDAPQNRLTWNSNGSTAMPGAEGYDSYSRAMRIAEPGTLNMIGQEETSRFETYNRYNKLIGNIFFGTGPKAATSGGAVLTECAPEEYNGVYTEVYLNSDPASNKDYSGGCWKDPAMHALYNGILAWIPVDGETSLGTATKLYGNECDYNVYYGGAQKIDQQYATARGYEADANSAVSESGYYLIDADRESFELTLVVDDTFTEVKLPALTGEYLGASTLYQQEGYDFFAPDVVTDFFGRERDMVNTVPGPFADLKAGVNIYKLWPAEGAGTGGQITDSDLVKSTFKVGSFTGSNGTTINYRLREGAEAGQPLMIWMHGIGAVGTDNKAQLSANDDAVVKLARYSPNWSVLAAQYPAYPGDLDAWLLAYSELVQSLIDAGTADPNRVYLGGGSMGGGQSWRFVTEYPELFACVFTCATLGTINDDLTGLDTVIDAGIPVRLYHAASDSGGTPASNSQEIYDYLKTNGGADYPTELTIFSDADMAAANITVPHWAGWLLAFADETLMPWIWEQAKETKESPYTVRQDGSGDFTTIQEAVNAAQPGDTVEVYGGTYREEVVLPQGGTDEENRITLKAAEGEEVIVTGSDIVQPDEWEAVEGMPGVYKLVKPNSYFPGHRETGKLPGSTTDLGEYNPFNQFWRSRANASSPTEGSGDDQKLGYVSCGMVYLNGEPMNQLWSLNGEDEGITNDTFGTVAETPNTWIAYVDKTADGEPDKVNGNTTIYANFGDADPTDLANDTEINVRMQCITAEWNQGYITIDGFTVMRGAGPKTVDFWQTRAEGMFGAISTNGGYYWIIENCDVTQCRGVGIDFGNGSRGQEDRYGFGYDYGDYSDNTPGGYNGNGPDLYGYHIIRYCDVFDNATNGMFAYRGAYTEVYGCTFVNNNSINTGLASEAYFKDVSGGYGINLHDNYFYSDQSWNTMPIWMDCECDNAIVANNIIYAAGQGSADGFSNITYELNAGWNLFANNIIINCGISNGVNGNFNVMNNLLINTGNFSVIGSAKQARAGAEGGTSNAATISDEYTTVDPASARNRTNRVVVPGTLEEISTVGNPTSRFDGYSRYNKFMGNILFGSTSPNTSGTNYDEATRVTGYGEFVLKRQDECEPGHVSMPDFSGGVAYFHQGLPDVVELINAGTIFDWAWVYAAGEAGNRPIERTTYGNEADWNVHYGLETRPSGWDSRGFEEHGIVVSDSEGYNYVINGDRNSFSITLDVDDSAIVMNPPLFTSEFMGPSDMLLNLGYESYPPGVETDILGNQRDMDNNVAGPFADLKAGTNTYRLWPAENAGKIG